jgi:hypothetical protein
MDIVVSTEVYVIIGPLLDFTDMKTPMSSLTLVQADILLNKNQGGDFFPINSPSPSVSNQGNGYYKVHLDETDTEGVGTLTVAIVKSGVLYYRVDFSVLSEQAYNLLYSPAVLGVNIIQINGLNTDDNLATLKLKQLDIQNNAGTALIAKSVGGGGYGMDVRGEGAGAGIRLQGGGTFAHGVLVYGSQNGIHVEGSSGGIGLFVQGGDGVRARGMAAYGAGIAATGGTGGDGINAQGNGIGNGVKVIGGGGGGDGLNATSLSQGSGIRAVAGLNFSGSGIIAQGNLNGAGIVAIGGANGPGINALGNGAGHGIDAGSAVSGDGIRLQGGNTAGNGIRVISPTASGVKIDGAASGASGVEVSGEVGVSIQGVGANGVNISGIGDGVNVLGTNGNGVTLHGAVSEKDISAREIGGGGGGLTAQETRDAMKLAPTAGAPAAGSIDDLLNEIDSKTTNLPSDPASESAILDAISAIQNNTTFVGVVQSPMIIPDSGSTLYVIYARLFDNIGNPEDPDGNVINLVIKNSAGSVIVPSVPMTRTGVGRYQYPYTILSSDVKGPYVVFFTYSEIAVSFEQVRTFEKVSSDDISDIHTILANTEDIMGQTDKMQFTGSNDIKATLDGETTDFGDASKTFVKDALYSRQVTDRHTNQKPKTVLMGTGANQVTVNTTVDSNGNISKEEIA